MSTRDPIPVSFSAKSVTIACTNRERSEHFYVGVLGAVAIPGDGYGCPWYRLGSLVISLMENADQPSPSTFPDHAMPILWVDVDDIRRAYEHLKDAGTPIIQAPDDDMFILVTDPDGLVIEIWQRDNDDPGDGS